MENAGTIIWKDEIVGTVSNIISDMWYLEADWKPNQSNASTKFMDLIFFLNAEDVIKDSRKGIVARLQYNTTNSNTNYVLILSVNNSELFMRLISDELAAYADR